MPIYFHDQLGAALLLINTALCYQMMSANMENETNEA